MDIQKEKTDIQKVKGTFEYKCKYRKGRARL